MSATSTQNPQATERETPPGSNSGTVEHFSDGLERALGNLPMQAKQKAVLGFLRAGRDRVIPPDSPTNEARRRGKLIRQEVIGHLDVYLEEFVTNAEANGIHVHIARTAADARRIVLDIAKRHDVKSVAKGKSMVSEECEVREALEHEGMIVTETDLGELLVQFADEKPSGLIAPAMHMDMERIAEVLRPTSPDGAPLPADPKTLMDVSRKWLRGRFFEADMGITGANFGIADTGSFFIVTNEGNGRMSSTLPRVHVAMMGIERLLPNLESVPTIQQLLIRSGTNQWMTTYMSFFSGPRRKGEVHGPEEQHLVLVDNGRSRALGTEFEEILQCIRCGMCQAACPVYERAGGHSYQSVYSGPIGKIVTPVYGESPIANELPHASSLCGACKEVCPVDIDIPRMLIALRTKFHFYGPLGGLEPLAVRIAGKIMASPSLYAFGSKLARLGQGFFVRNGWITNGPGPLKEWTLNRDLPAIASETFHERQRRRKAAHENGEGI